MPDKQYSNPFHKNFFYFAGLDARGFLFGPLVSMNLQVPFIPVRKTGKLPGPTIQVASTKEYGKVSFFFLLSFSLIPL